MSHYIVIADTVYIKVEDVGEKSTDITVRKITFYRLIKAGGPQS